METTVRNLLKSIVLKNLDKSTVNVFDEFVEECQRHYDRPSHTLQDLKEKNNTKTKGDIFEVFCLLYLKNFSSPPVDAWLLKDLPRNIRDELGLPTNDVGIDIVVRNKEKYWAIQAKYRKRNPYKQATGIGWKQLSTFYGIVNKTGPFEKHVVMTNVNYVRHIGKKTSKDRSICLTKFRSTPIETWLRIAGMEGAPVNSTIPSVVLTPEELRKKRLEKLQS